LIEKKNLIKPPHGEYIAVEKLESIYKSCTLIENICVYASNTKNELIALVNPDKKNLSNTCSKSNINVDNWEELCSHPKVEEIILKELNKTATSAGLRSIEKLSAVLICHEEWTPDNGCLTAAMKIKRQDLHQKFKDDIKRKYDEIEEKN